MNTFDYDIVIVGGGLAGGSLALALRQTPLRVAIIEASGDDERRASPAGQRALALARGSAQILQQLGVWPRIEDRTTPIRHIHVSDRGHFGKTRIDADREGVAALGYVATARTIEDGVAAELSGGTVDLIQPARLIGLQASDTCICVSLKHGDEALSFTSRLVVGADGGSSSVRRLLDIPQQVRDYQQTAIVLEVDAERDCPSTAYERFTAAGPLALLPVGRKRYSVIWTLRTAEADEQLALPDALFRDRLQDAFGHWVGRLELATPRVGFPLSLIRAARMTDQRVVLIGNAMHQIHPVAGQGFNLGLRDAAQLAEMLTVRQRFGEDIGDAELLSDYAAARRKDLNNVVLFTDSLVRLFSTSFAPLALVRNLGLVALDNLPGAKRLLARHAMGLGGRIPLVG